MWAREWGEVQPKANLNIPQLETAQCSTRRWISRQSLATGYSYFPSLSLPGFIFSSLLFRPFSPSSQTGRHMSNEKGGEKYSSQISQGDREGRRGREIGGNKSTPLSFHRLFLTFSHTLLHHELILHSLLFISFSSYRLNMSRRQTSTRLFCPPFPTSSLLHTHSTAAHERESTMNESIDFKAKSDSVNSSKELHADQSPAHNAMKFYGFDSKS